MHTQTVRRTYARFSELSQERQDKEIRLSPAALTFINEWRSVSASIDEKGNTDWTSDESDELTEAENKQLDSLALLCEEVLSEIAHEALKSLRAEQEYHTSREAIIEGFEANETQFLLSEEEMETIEED